MTAHLDQKSIGERRCAYTPVRKEINLEFGRPSKRKEGGQVAQDTNEPFPRAVMSREKSRSFSGSRTH